MTEEQQPVVAEITSEAYVYDAPPPEPGLIRIALVSPVRFAGGGTGF
ncbi:hypothetical protein [Streptomyces sp. HC307]